MEDILYQISHRIVSFSDAGAPPTVQLGSTQDAIVANKGLPWDFLRKMLHDLGGDWNHGPSWVGVDPRKPEKKNCGKLMFKFDEGYAPED